MTDAEEPSLDFARLRARYGRGKLSVVSLVDALLQRIDKAGDDKVWISRVPAEALRRRAAVLDAAVTGMSAEAVGDRFPLFGIPFAVKDNIDVAGLPTTAACPAFAYTPEITAHCVARLEEAGAILIGKTNLDQFATGLVGSRSPYGVPRNPFDSRFIPGGSSSGSAVAVAVGLVSFALGTDTAGSGRVPAAFNNVVGLKPTRGRISTRGVVPACRSLDCISIFALCGEDAAAVLEVCGGFDRDDPFARRAPNATRQFQPPFRFAVPRAADLEFFGDRESPALFARAVSALEALGGTCVEFDLTPFRVAGDMLYGGPWVAERLAAIETLYRHQPEALLPVTRQIIAAGDRWSAVDTFTAQYRLAALRREAERVWEGADVLLLPTAATIYTLAAIEADPIALNANLGRYTAFANLLDLAAMAVPAGFRADGLPFGVSVIGPAFSDGFLATVAGALHQKFDLPLGATRHRLAPARPRCIDTEPDQGVELAVVGSHLSGMALNHELTQNGALLIRSALTAATYRLYLLDGDPRRPGMLRVGAQGEAIEVEIWRLDATAFGAFVAQIPPPLTIGTLVLSDGRLVKGFLCEAEATRNAEDISAFGGWRQFVAARGI
ncbi:MAG TPA: allophanate hydrolase [Stellaceae bacterium]|nr:allophanate hydrolase [Stellaceae bacterium]